MIRKPLFWHQGLFLQPQHFQLFEAYLKSLATPFCEYSVPSFWGVADLEISKPALATNTLHIGRGVFLFPDGTYIELPGNAIIHARSFAESWADRLNVFIGLRKWNDSGLNVAVQEPAEFHPEISARYIAPENPEEISDLHAGGPAGRVRRMTHILRILWERELEQAGDYAVIPVCRLVRHGAQVRIADDFIPPSLNLSGSLLKLLTEVRDQVTSRAHQLEQYKKDRGLHCAEFGSRDMVYILALGILARHAPLLHHYIETRQVHPWLVYGTLRRLIGELSVFSERVNLLGELGDGRRVILPYDHRGLWGCFSSAQDMISHLLDELTAGAEYIVRLNFDGIYHSADLMGSVLEGRGRFYISIRTDEPLESVLQAIRTVVKVGSTEDLRIIVARALPGIPLEHQVQLPRELPYRMNTHYFLVGSSGEQWESVAKNRNIALYWSNAPPDLQIELMVVRRS